MSLHWLIPQKVGFFRGPATVGLIQGQTGWILIDSGVEAAVPKKILKALKEEIGDEALGIRAVINTHAHADHCGGNKWLQAHHGALVYASEGERVYIETPALEPHYLYSAEAPKQLKGKFFQAETSRVDKVIKFDDLPQDTCRSGQSVNVTIDGINLEIVSIPGHSVDMIGVITPDGFIFCGDLLFAPAILEKHPLLFKHDYKSYLESLDWLSKQQFKGYILTHGGHFDVAVGLIEAVQYRLESNFHLIMASLKSTQQMDSECGLNESEIHQNLVKALGLEEDFGGWHLNHAVLRSYLSYALEQKLIKWEKGLYQHL